MAERIVRERLLTDEEAAKYDRLRTQVEGELPDLLAGQIEAPGHAHPEDLEEERQLAAFLHAERERQGISIDEIVRRTGYKLADVQAFEEGRFSNPPLAMLTRFARALGKRVLFSLRSGGAWRDPRPTGQATRLN